MERSDREYVKMEIEVAKREIISRIDVNKREILTKIDLITKRLFDVQERVDTLEEAVRQIRRVGRLNRIQVQLAELREAVRDINERIWPSSRDRTSGPLRSMLGNDVEAAIVHPKEDHD